MNDPKFLRDQAKRCRILSTLAWSLRVAAPLPHSVALCRVALPEQFQPIFGGAANPIRSERRSKPGFVQFGDFGSPYRS